MMRDFSIDLVWAKLQAAFTAIGGWLGYFVGGVDGLMTALLIFIALDYVTGVMCAIVDKKLSSEVGFKGICKKTLIIILVGVANIVDVHVVGTGSGLRSAVICFYLSNEGVSVLENAAHLGLPIPEKLKDILAQLHKRAEKEKGQAETEAAEAADSTADTSDGALETVTDVPTHDETAEAVQTAANNTTEDNAEDKADG